MSGPMTEDPRWAGVRTWVAEDSGPCEAACGDPCTLMVDGTRIHWRCFLAGRAPAPSDVAPTSGRTWEQGGSARAEPDSVGGSGVALLDALMNRFAPRRRDAAGKKLPPLWCPPVPEPLELVRTGRRHSRNRRYTGPITVLDRSGAFLADLISAAFAHGGLQHTGPIPFTGLPGIYKVPVMPWMEKVMPHPLGPDAKPDTEVWLAEPRVKLLAELAAQGRWADDPVTVLDSWTGEPVRFDAWGGWLKEQRAAALAHGHDSDEYERFKRAFGRGAVGLLAGSPRPGQGRQFKYPKIQRPDIAITLKEQNAAMMWRKADQCAQVCPEAPPVGIAGVDELRIPSGSLEAVTTRARGHLGPAIRLDPTGVAVGSFKIKGGEA